MHDHVSLEIKFTQGIKKLLSETHLIRRNLYIHISF